MNPIPLAVLLLFVAPQPPNPPQSQLTQQPSREQLGERREQSRQVAVHLNELAGSIHSETDARVFVDTVADQFSNGELQSWATTGIRHRVARAEFQAVSDPAKLIPEQRIVDIWNEYIRELDAPAEALVNAAEVHNLRDATFTMSHVVWDRKGMQQLWTIPSIYAVGTDGKISGGCRRRSVEDFSRHVLLFSEHTKCPRTPPEGNFGFGSHPGTGAEPNFPEGILEGFADLLGQHQPVEDGRNPVRAGTRRGGLSPPSGKTFRGIIRSRLRGKPRFAQGKLFLDC